MLRAPCPSVQMKQQRSRRITDLPIADQRRFQAQVHDISVNVTLGPFCVNVPVPSSVPSVLPVAMAPYARQSCLKCLHRWLFQSFCYALNLIYSSGKLERTSSLPHVIRNCVHSKSLSSVCAVINPPGVSGYILRTRRTADTHRADGLLQSSIKRRGVQTRIQMKIPFPDQKTIQTIKTTTIQWGSETTFDFKISGSGNHLMNGDWCE